MAGAWFMKSQGGARRHSWEVVNYVNTFTLGLRRWSHVSGFMVEVTDCFLAKLPCQSWVSGSTAQSMLPSQLCLHSGVRTCRIPLPSRATQSPGPYQAADDPGGRQHHTLSRLSGPASCKCAASWLCLPNLRLSNWFILFVSYSPIAWCFFTLIQFLTLTFLTQSLPLLSGISIPWLTNSSHPYLLLKMSLYSFILARLSPRTLLPL